jgi:hypothetical protein
MEHHPVEGRISIVPVPPPILPIKVKLNISPDRRPLNFHPGVEKIRTAAMIPLAGIMHLKGFTAHCPPGTALQMLQCPDDLKPPLGQPERTIKALDFRHFSSWMR